MLSLCAVGARTAICRTAVRGAVWDATRSIASSSVLLAYARSKAVSKEKRITEKSLKRPRNKTPILPTPPPPPKCLIAAHVVERLPVITPLPEPWEEEMWDLQERKENAVRKDVPPDFYGDSMDGPVKDQEEMIIAPRETEADKANDIKSRRRALDRRLYLLIKGADGKWDFPQTEWKQGEKMREAAARSLVDRCGTEFVVYEVGNCPMAYVDVGEGDSTRRIFFYYSQYIRGELELEQKLAKDYMWLKREELHDYLGKEVTALTDDICDP